LLTDDKELYNWLTGLEEYGFVVVTGSPHQPGQLQRIAERVAFLRQTNIG
jgi:gamma-butyrobetaine dioxygenase